MEDYRERLIAPPSWWVAALIFGGICGWIMVVATTPTWGLAAAAVAFAAAASLVMAYGSLAIRAGADGLHVGAAFLPREFIGKVSALDRVDFRTNIGPEVDARAWLRTRPYVDGGVRVDVTDPADPTPYWLVSSRRPEAVVAALGQPVGHTGPARNEGNAG